MSKALGVLLIAAGVYDLVPCLAGAPDFIASLTGNALGVFQYLGPLAAGAAIGLGIAFFTR